MLTYKDWFNQQTPERRLSSLVHLDNCRKLGELQRTRPHSIEAVQLEQEIAEYYKANN